MFFFFWTYMLLYLCMAVLSLHCCTWAFSSCKEQGLLPSCDASRVAEHVLQGAWASVPQALEHARSLVMAHGPQSMHTHQLWLTGPRACTLISCDMQNVDHVPTLVGNGHQMNNNGVQRPPLSSREKRLTMYCPCLLWKRQGRITLHVLYMYLSHIIGNLLVSKKIVVFNHMTSYSTQFWLLVS